MILKLLDHLYTVGTILLVDPTTFTTLKFNTKAEPGPINLLNVYNHKPELQHSSVLTVRLRQSMQSISQGKTTADPQLLSLMNLQSCTVAKCRGFGSSFSFLEILTFSNSGHIFLALSLV